MQIDGGAPDSLEAQPAERLSTTQVTGGHGGLMQPPQVARLAAAFAEAVTAVQGAQL